MTSPYSNSSWNTWPALLWNVGLAVILKNHSYLWHDWLFSVRFPISEASKLLFLTALAKNIQSHCVPASNTQLLARQNRVTCLHKGGINLFLSCIWAFKSFIWLTGTAHSCNDPSPCTGLWLQTAVAHPVTTLLPPPLSLSLRCLVQLVEEDADEELCFVCFSWRREHISQCCRS